MIIDDDDDEPENPDIALFDKIPFDTDQKSIVNDEDWDEETISEETNETLQAQYDAIFKSKCWKPKPKPHP